MSTRTAALYARFSTDLQNDRSIADQFAVCETYAASNDLIITHRYEDRAKSSATLFGRDGLLAMIAAAKAGAFRVIVVEALDRISRNPADLHSLFQSLDFAGVSIEEVSRGKADAISVGLSGLVGQLFLAGLKEKTRRGLAGVVRDGRSAGGRAYGYAPVPGKPGELVIVPEEAAIVRRIFEEYATGNSTRDIAAGLNADGIESPRGSLWRASILTGNRARNYGILLNDLYHGERIWNRVHMVRNPDTGKRISRTNPEHEWQRQPAPQLRIVTEPVWQAVQRRLNDNRWSGKGRGKKPKRPLAGLLTCAHCGSTITIRARRASGAVYAACTGATETHICEHKEAVRLDQIEADILGRLAELLRDPVYLKAYLDSYHEERRRLAQDASKDRNQLERAATKARAAFDRAERLYIDGIADSPEALQRLRELKSARDIANAALAESDEPPKVVAIHPDATRRYLEALDNLVPTLTEAAEQGQPKAMSVLRELISDVRISRTETGVSLEIYGYLGALLPDRDTVYEKSGSVRVFRFFSYAMNRTGTR